MNPSQPLLRQSWSVVAGDCRETLRTLDAGSVQTCVTSPPYFGLRDYGHDGQIGLEPSPDEFVTALLAVFREVRRVLADDGTVWLNLGDSYNNRAVNRPSSHQAGLGFESDHLGTSWRDHAENGRARMSINDGDLKEKDLLGIPWMVAFALRADGWYLRSDIIWSKPNPMPESVTDRPTKAHEYLFLLSKSARYFYDAAAIKEEVTCADDYRGRDRMEPEWSDRSRRGITPGPSQGHLGIPLDGRNRRSVWTVSTQPFPGAHFATFPPKLIEPCILAGSRPGDVVLDPFAGSGTTGMVALRHDRSFVGCELNPKYVDLARERIIADSPLLNTNAELAA